MMNSGLTPEIVEGPYDEPVTLTQAKAHLRVDTSDDDTYISALITAARQHAEDFCQRSFTQRRYRLTLDSFPVSRDYPIYLPMGPVQSVDHIKYYGTGSPSGLVTWSNEDYIVDTSQVPARVTPATDGVWPSDVEQRIAAVQIQYVAGYQSDSSSPTDYAANVPGPVKQGILMLIGHLYENRQDAVVGRIVSDMPFASQALLFPYRVELL
jgi:uncharacterized phiE125 gp8 family phage protein